MNRPTFLYALWCLLVILATMLAGQSGYSPFADGGRSIFVYGPSRPQHK